MRSKGPRARRASSPLATMEVAAQALAEAVKAYDPLGSEFRDKAGASDAEVKLTNLARETAAAFAGALKKLQECQDGASCDYCAEALPWSESEVIVGSDNQYCEKCFEMYIVCQSCGEHPCECDDDGDEAAP